MFTALALAIGQLGDRRIVAVLVKTIAITLAVFVVLGWLAWLGLGALLAGGDLPVSGEVRALLIGIATVIGGWLLFRLVALAVIQLFADEVVSAVEAKHYPHAANSVQSLGWKMELAVAMRGLQRAAGYNLIALPFALALLLTGLGPALLFAAVNAVLLGRELNEMVALRHRDAQGEIVLLRFTTRLALGGLVVLLLTVPFINLLAPVLGAASATHLVHRRSGQTRGTIHAP